MAHIDEEEDTDTKIAILSSLFPHLGTDFLFEALIGANGSVEDATKSLASPSADPFPVPAESASTATPESAATPLETDSPPPKRQRLAAVPDQQLSLHKFQPKGSKPAPRRLTKTGQTLHLYDPEDIAAHTPCSIIHNFLPAEDATALLVELLDEVKTFRRDRFKLFDRVVESPHSASFYVGTPAEQRAQTTEYVYNGGYLSDVRRATPVMLRVSGRVEAAVNDEIARRIRDFYPAGRKLACMSPARWQPNAAFVNCYASAQESVGAHADQLTYIGPRAVIGSLSLGVAREFRVRKVVPKENEVADAEQDDEARDVGDAPAVPPPGSPSRKRKKAGAPDEEGQIAIHLPHNSLLVMHAEMQEEWKHAIAPAQRVTPHPVAGTKRINVTYRHYRADFHPKFTPRCRCGFPTVLRCVQRRQANHGRYMWMCHTNYSPDKTGCGFFEWADFDDDGKPKWAAKALEEGASAYAPFNEETVAVKDVQGNEPVIVKGGDVCTRSDKLDKDGNDCDPP